APAWALREVSSWLLTKQDPGPTGSDRGARSALWQEGPLVDQLDADLGGPRVGWRCCRYLARVGQDDEFASDAGGCSIPGVADRLVGTVYEGTVDNRRPMPLTVRVVGSY